VWISYRIQNKSVEYVRRFWIENNYTHNEKEAQLSLLRAIIFYQNKICLECLCVFNVQWFGCCLMVAWLSNGLVVWWLDGGVKK
jgi:hypothetical protein